MHKNFTLFLLKFTKHNVIMYTRNEKSFLTHFSEVHIIVEKDALKIGKGGVSYVCN